MCVVLIGYFKGIKLLWRLDYVNRERLQESISSPFCRATRRDHTSERLVYRSSKDPEKGERPMQRCSDARCKQPTCITQQYLAKLGESSSKLDSAFTLYMRCTGS